MTISSSLSAGVAGLSVNASKLGTISDNIANSATYGYKRATADFQALVMEQTPGRYAAGGVRVTTGREVDQRGTLISTNNSTDLAISGRGMLPVTPFTSIGQDGTLPLQLTTTGSFRPDANGVLRTDSGLVLLGWAADENGEIGVKARDSVADLEPVIIDSSSLEANATSEITLGLNLPATDTAGDERALTVEYFDSFGQSQDLTMTFTNASDAANPYRWELVITDGAQTNAVVAAYTIDFDVTPTNAGNLLAIADGTTGPANPASSTYDPATGSIQIVAIDEANTTGAGLPISLQIGQIGVPGPLTQLSDTFAPLAVTKNGSPVGNLAGVEVDEGGNLIASYDNGFSKRLYQIPVADVRNLNGLEALSNQTFQVSDESGRFYLWDAGSGPVGDMASFTREESAVDVAQELTQLIQTQRAYNSNAKVIQTVDEMWQETTNIKR
ncbi:flagellar hook protein FlgE [Jannaschia seohaensis]|uniref:Flagellar hook protein FlgE n=1 Tax=Jannaschia seohaensis TaxID=475081 RepID=A0A2Y9A244_9RHOB|nr:flagellar hook-basal body complex protein [Jannaschia seohaensis]PWJ22333.1 flagellar hook protein FlgE [Jannaschia seohaensis]SSA38611.1 flagellar hook protein FlgE [Jannaschia seohaensis]